jgi:hypothetical protein
MDRGVIDASIIPWEILTSYDDGLITAQTYLVRLNFTWTNNEVFGIQLSPIDLAFLVGVLPLICVMSLEEYTKLTEMQDRLPSGWSIMQLAVKA